MTNDDIVKLAALQELLSLMDPEDWHLLSRVVREDVAAGKLSKEVEERYAAIVDNAVGHETQE
jgi:hypothetical protein